jgi:hypothetical protein
LQEDISANGQEDISANGQEDISANGQEDISANGQEQLCAPEAWLLRKRKLQVNSRINKQKGGCKCRNLLVLIV